MIVTIDGPAGSGKSTAARRLAERLNFQYLDTGAMYRAVAYTFVNSSINLHDTQSVAQFLSKFQLELNGERVFANGQDVTSSIRDAEISEAASKVSALPAVREKLVSLQRQIAQGRNIICEGRDQGSVVFPEAECKFFLTAELEARAIRRQAEAVQRGESLDLAALMELIQTRDRRDSEREVAPLRKPEGAIVLDTTSLTVEEMLDKMEREVRRCLKCA